MNVLAVVSKAIFEKEARNGKALCDIGAVWPTARYASASPHLSPLASGGALFLVTVRPGDRLWLVGVLEAPTKDAKGWGAPANVVPIRDVSALVPQLRFASGKGVTAEPGKLGMSLQTPRVLTDDDVALLRGHVSGSDAAPSPQAAYASAVDSSSVMQQAAAYGQRVLAEAQAAGGLEWKLDNRRTRKRWKSLTASEKEVLAKLEDELEGAEEFGGCELLDVIDVASGAVVAIFALWPFGSGVVVDVATKEELGDVIQHYFDAHGQQALRTRLAAAYAEARSRLKIAESVDFTPGDDSPKRVPPTKADASTLVAIRAMRAQLAADPAALEGRDAQAALSQLMGQVIDFEKYAPVPVRRLFELSEIERELLELVEDGTERAQLWPYGLPDPLGRAYRRDAPHAVGGPLAHFLGRVPPGPLDEAIVLEGNAHPIWCLLHDAIHGVRPVDAVLAIVDALPTQQRIQLARTVLTDPTTRLTRVLAKDLKELRGDVMSKATTEPQRERRAALRNGLLLRLGAEGEALARALIAGHADWAEKYEPMLSKNPHLIAPHWTLFCTVLAVLAQRAHERGEALEASYDPLLATLALASYSTEALIPVLALLPIARAGKIACGRLTLIREFPSDEGALAARRFLATLDGGPWSAKLFLTTVKALGERMRPYLEEARVGVPERGKLTEECLAALDKAAAKKGGREAGVKKAKK